MNSTLDWVKCNWGKKGVVFYNGKDIFEYMYSTFDLSNTKCVLFFDKSDNEFIYIDLITVDGEHNYEISIIESIKSMYKLYSN
jgi:hypothetical protein